MIRISSVIINLLLPLLLFAAGAEQNFSNQIPGQIPDGWNFIWKKSVDDVIYISNAGDPSHPEKRQMVIDRAHGDDHSYYRIGRMFQLENMADSDAVFLDFRFKIVCGSTAEAPFEMEFGHPQKKQFLLNFGLRNWGPFVFLYPTSLPTWTNNWEGKQKLGDFSKGRWQRIRLLVPYGKNSTQKRCYGTLYDPDGKPGKIFSIPVKIPMEEKTWICIVPGDRKKGA